MDGHQVGSLETMIILAENGGLIKRYLFRKKWTWGHLTPLRPSQTLPPSRGNFPRPRGMLNVVIFAVPKALSAQFWVELLSSTSYIQMYIENESFFVHVRAGTTTTAHVTAEPICLRCIKQTNTLKIKLSHIKSAAVREHHWNETNTHWLQLLKLHWTISPDSGPWHQQYSSCKSLCWESEPCTMWLTCRTSFLAWREAMCAAKGQILMVRRGFGTEGTSWLSLVSDKPRRHLPSDTAEGEESWVGLYWKIYGKCLQ
jgi:hypothetical protein